MKQVSTATTGTETSNNLELLTDGQKRAIALQQYHGNKYFIIDEDENTLRIFEGELLEVKKDFDTSDETDFLNYCIDNLTEVEDYDVEDYGNDYLVLTDSEADEKAKEYILDSVWAFNASFLAGETGIDEEVFTAIQANDRCESNNSAILRLIDDEDSFVESAISADGRGHFMNSYDGNENEENVFGDTYYIYRVN